MKFKSILALLLPCLPCLAVQMPPNPAGLKFSNPVFYSPSDPRWRPATFSSFTPAAQPPGLPEMYITNVAGFTYAGLYQKAGTEAHIDYTTEGITGPWNTAAFYGCVQVDQWVFVGHPQVTDPGFKFFKGYLTPCTAAAASKMPQPFTMAVSATRLKIKGVSYRLLEIPALKPGIKAYRLVR